MAIRMKEGQKDLMKDVFALRENPFRISQIYNLDQRGTYVREMYGEQLNEFRQKFFGLPLQKETNKQVLGAIWSSHSGDAWGKGFGKSMLMAEESVQINQDFGADMLRQMGVVEEDISRHPVLAGYCSFDQSKDVKTFAAALLDAVAFMLSSSYGKTTVHHELRSRIAKRLDAEPGFEGEAVKEALRTEIRRYKSLNLQLNHKTVSEFIDLLSSEDTDALTTFIRNEIGPRIKAAQGFNFVHVFNAFVSLAGIVYVAYFIDQIENFSKWARNQDRDIRVLRESICQTSPTADIASFIFQMHIRAQEVMEDWWNSEHLPSLDFALPANATRIVDLKGLAKKGDAIALAEKYLAKFRVPETSCPALFPFTEEIIEAVRVAKGNNPRKFLEALCAVLEHAIIAKRERLDLAFVQPLIGDGEEAAAEEEIDEEFGNPTR